MLGRVGALGKARAVHLFFYSSRGESVPKTKLTISMRVHRERVGLNLMCETCPYTVSTSLPRVFLSCVSFAVAAVLRFAWLP